MTLEDVRDQLARTLEESATTVVFAESCTGGLCAATMAQVDGISSHLCGSAVTYMPAVKQAWLDVKPTTIAAHTCESLEVAEEMAFGVLQRTQEAAWAASVVGDLADGKVHRIFISIFGRDGQTIVKHQTEVRLLFADTRVERQREAARSVLEMLCRVILKANSLE